MARCIESNKDTSSGQVRQAPVPTRRGASAVVRRHERLVGCPEAPSVGGPNGQPNDIQQEVKQNHKRREVEDVAEGAGCAVSYRSVDTRAVDTAWTHEAKSSVELPEPAALLCRSTAACETSLP